ncbi:hypothetical protein [Streptomyces sp. DT171]|uniref:hypothetical protein n=1 Tax=Streptomyces sp. DT171 TaxID=3416524 RepID=UPI003CF6CBC8
MTTFLNYLGILALFALVALPALIGAARDLRVDRALRRAEQGRDDGPPGAASDARPVLRRAPVRTSVTGRAQKSSSKPTEPSTATW